MNNLLVFAAHNTVFAIVFALVVYGLTRVWRNPPVAHVLWLLVLLKLVVPPVVHVDWLALQLPDSTSAYGQRIADGTQGVSQQPQVASRDTDQPMDQTTAQAVVVRAKEHDFAARITVFWIHARPIVFWFWLGGAALSVVVAATRIVRFERLLQDTLPAPERLQRLTREIAGKIGIRRVPDVRFVECADVPLVWWAGRRPRIVLPMRLVRQLDDQQIALILGHELAHLRRRDHWVRVIELMVSAVYWWNPLVWMIRRQLHSAEDLSCDAWVRWSFPDSTTSYAEVVLKTAESLSASQVSARLLPASPFLRSLSLKERIEMILESRFAPQVSARSMFVATLLGLLILPAFVQITATKAFADSKDDAPAKLVEKTEAPTTSEFPHKVKFEQGATRFKEGDNITILEVRGTDKTFIPGNIYWIKGKFKLASQDRATLAAFTTAKNAADGTSRSLKVQMTDVQSGKGTFTLFLPMLCEGWPHVSFYGASDGEGMGGNYFGTGDSVLKQW